MRGALLILLLGATGLSARETVDLYEVQIQVQADGRVDVTEDLDVTAEGQSIRHGIYRDLPDTYRRPGWNKLGPLWIWRTPMSMDAVTQDGRPCPWFSKGRENGSRYYAGSKTELVTSGPHHYQFRYHYQRVLKFLPDHDELYWNVTGNGWDFPLLKVKASVKLPGDTGNAMLLKAYTGTQGEVGQDYSAHQGGGDLALFETTRVLAPSEGLTVVVGWPKGLVKEPGPIRELLWNLGDFWRPLLAALSLLLVLVYLFNRWRILGVDPPKRPAVPRFYPPRDMPPAALRYLDDRGNDKAGFSATLLHAAVQGYLSLTPDPKKKGQWVLRALKERTLADTLEGWALTLFGKKSQVSTASDSDAEDFRKAALKHEVALARLWKAEVEHNAKPLGLAVGLSLLLIGASALAHANALLALGLGTLCLGLGAIQGYALASVPETLRPGRMGVLWNQLFWNIFVGLIMVVGLGAILFAAAESGVFWSALQGSVCGLAIGAFGVWMPRPSVKLQALRDEIQGFTMYLNTAERKRLETLNPPDDTPELFERYLPYALALGVANTWTKRFTKVLAEARAHDTYHPVWMAYGSMNATQWSSSLTSLGSGFSGSITSASAPPSQGSSGFGGSGGGVSSGGGGGGGGGGGW